VNRSIRFSVNAKKKILFVVSEFYQAGTQRFTYEIDRALNKDRFEVSILCLLPLGSSAFFKDYYYEKHQEIGTKVFFMEEVNTLRIPTFLERVKRKLFAKPLPNEREAIQFFFDQFETIAVMGEYNYKEIERFLSPANKLKIVIHIQNSLYQKSDLYAAYTKNEHFHFVSGFYPDQIAFELHEFERYRHTYFTLNLLFEPLQSKTAYCTNQVAKIGIFTRLTHTKPITPFLESFAALLKINQQCELHIFGAGDPEKEGVIAEVRALQIAHAVFFRGHQTSITETAVNENIDLALIHGYHGLPGGWVSFDLSRAGIPQLFWDFGHTESSVANEAFPMYQDVNQLANACNNALTNPDYAQKLAQQQLLEIRKEHDIERNISILEEIYRGNKRHV
jgi:glycosyltransferase involved in cell wall biosynthesis